MPQPVLSCFPRFGVRGQAHEVLLQVFLRDGEVSRRHARPDKQLRHCVRRIKRPFFPQFQQGRV